MKAGFMGDLLLSISSENIKSHQGMQPLALRKRFSFIFHHFLVFITFQINNNIYLS